MTRILIIKAGCVFCLEYLRIVDRINLRLPPDKKIIVIDAFEFENFGITAHPIMDKFEPKDFDSYPFCYLDGIVFQGGAQSKQLKKMLEGYLEQDFVI